MALLLQFLVALIVGVVEKVLPTFVAEAHRREAERRAAADLGRDEQRIKGAVAAAQPKPPEESK